MKGFHLPDAGRLAQLWRPRSRKPVQTPMPAQEIGRHLKGASPARSGAEEDGEQFGDAERARSLHEHPLARPQLRREIHHPRRPGRGQRLRIAFRTRIMPAKHWRTLGGSSWSGPGAPLASPSCEGGRGRRRPRVRRSHPHIYARAIYNMRNTNAATSIPRSTARFNRTVNPNVSVNTCKSTTTGGARPTVTERPSHDR